MDLLEAMNAVCEAAKMLIGIVQKQAEIIEQNRLLDAELAAMLAEERRQAEELIEKAQGEA